MKEICIFAALTASVTGAYAQVIDKNLPENQTSGSLWQDGNNPLLDRTARASGDLVTILISETSVANFSASTTANKSDNNSIGMTALNSLFGLLKTAPTTTATGTQSGAGNTTQNGTLRARLTAEVKAITPRGHLIIEGRRLLSINKEQQTFILNGIIRRDDIAADNTVLSENIAQADIRMEGKGTIADRQRKGLLTQVLDWLF